MATFLTYFVCLLVIVISSFITLYFKSELERMFREKREVVAFHICNVLIVLLITFATYAVTSIFIFKNDLNIVQQLAILFCIILPIYIIGYFIFEKYKEMNRKYMKMENGKVLVINEKYLNKK